MNLVKSGRIWRSSKTLCSKVGKGKKGKKRKEMGEKYSTLVFNAKSWRGEKRAVQSG